MNEVLIICNNINGFIYNEIFFKNILIFEKIYKLILRWYFNSVEGILID